MDVKKLYSRRFSIPEKNRKNQVWKILCSCFFQKYVRSTDIVLDIGAGYCEFINNICCQHKIALDLNEETKQYADSEVRVIESRSSNICVLKDCSVDIAFTSNFLEHLPNKEELLLTLAEIYRVLRRDGKLLILQPNIRILHGKYWDFFDHHIPLSDRTLAEALELIGFHLAEVRPRFLPFTTKSRLPQHPWLIRLYLLLPPLQWLLGKQAWVVAVKP
jgi:ubiquinone/menaquinone biosynthesis C-methylase UbiE